MYDFCSVYVSLYPVEFTEEGLAHCDTNLASRASAWKANGNNAPSHHVAFA
jgi:hypothetical protein